MADEQQEIPQEKYVSLGSKETAITLNDVSPTKKREYKTIYLFGKKISVESYSLESNETAMPLFNVPISPEKEADEDLKTHKEDSVPVDLSLAISGNPNLTSKVTCAGNETAMLLFDVPISPAKEAGGYLKTHKEDSVPVDLSLAISGNPNITSKVTCAGNETGMLLVDVPISPAKEAGEDLKTHKEDSVSVYLSLAISGNPNLNSKVTCAEINKDLTTEDVRKIKKRRYLTKEEREEEKQTGSWTITKTLCMSDVRTNCRLTVDKKGAESHIIRHLSADAQRNIQEGIGVQVKTYDHDMSTEHDLIFKRHVSSKSYIFNGDWAKEFVRRRNLKEGDTIGLFWGNTDFRLHFSVLQRKQ